MAGSTAIQFTGKAELISFSSPEQVQFDWPMKGNFGLNKYGGNDKEMQMKRDG